MKNFAILCILTLLAGCADDIGANQYETSSVGEVNRALKGTVLSVRAIQVRDEGTAGTVIGAVAGGAAGTLLGSNDATRIAGGAVGAAAGAIAGKQAQKMVSSQGGYEYVIELDNGNVVNVSQGNDIMLNVGQRCVVLYGKRARVIPLNQ